MLTTRIIDASDKAMAFTAYNTNVQRLREYAASPSLADIPDPTYMHGFLHGSLCVLYECGWIDWKTRCQQVDYLLARAYHQMGL